MADDDYDYTDERLIDPSLKCSICRSPFIDPYSTPCKHTYCRECINHCLQNDNRCSICRRAIKRTDLTRAEASICDAVNQLLVTCKRCNETVQRGQFDEHIRNNCSGRRSDLSSSNTDRRRPIINPERIESLLNKPLRQCQQLREELERQRTEINHNHNHTNNDINTINGKLNEQQDEIEILRKSNATHQRKIQQLEHDLQIYQEETTKLENDNRRLQNQIKRFNNESNKSELRLCHLEQKIIRK
jgi:chromosome segregation ATPase